MALAITGLGMISSVGWDASASCAAIRAGLVRPHPLPGFTVLDEETQDMVPLVGHPIQGYTEGFAPLARWVRLAQGALDDLLRQQRMPGPADVQFWRRTRLFCIAPVLSAERFFEVRQAGAEDVMDAFTRLLHERLRKRIPVPPSRFLGLGHSGLAAALQEADRGISSAEAERYLLVAVDSYLDAYSLEWLAERRRLKTGDRPVGLMPGEAGACVLVESVTSARRRGAPVDALIESSAVERVPGATHQDGARLGAGLALAVAAVRQGRAASKPFDGDVIIDLNGEVWRANAWGHARVRLSDSLEARVRLVTFCGSVGEIGASSGAVAICIATRSFARRYASGPACLVVTTSEDGLAGCVLVRAAEGAT
jgi:3-oxoacyl-[acyl-carrier-protein] synthase-1